MGKTSIFLVIGLVLGFAVSYAMPFSNLKNQPAPEIQNIKYAPVSWKLWQNGIVDSATNSYWGYSIKYPRDFELKFGDSSAGQSFLGETPTQISFPDDAFKNGKTNFGGSDLSLSFSKKTKVADCLGPIDTQNSRTEPIVEKVAGINFKVQNLTEAGAGNIYRTKVYRAIIKNVCFEIGETLHTGNIANYTEGAVSEFDASKTQTIWNEILKTLSFTNQNPY